jgi:asparagine synthase (glutamine-hydrolysing)
MEGFSGVYIGKYKKRVLENLLSDISHHVPDSQCSFIGDIIGMGMRRLKIIDLDGGEQPICNESGGFQLVFNGEIYNYTELRDVLIALGYVFKTFSDTEVLVHLYQEMGMKMLSKLRGMFCFAIYDIKKR